MGVRGWRFNVIDVPLCKGGVPWRTTMIDQYDNGYMRVVIKHR